LRKKAAMEDRETERETEKEGMSQVSSKLAGRPSLLMRVVKEGGR
jgi:hypothetical protein